MDQSLQGMDVSERSTSNETESLRSDASASKPVGVRKGASFSNAFGQRNAFGRVNFAKYIPDSSIVYLQGSAGMIKIAAEAANMKHCKVVMGAPYDVDTNKAKKAGILDKVLPLSCCGRNMRSDLPLPV
eukprot:scaffold24387_cov60-Phaeocystis_antarctica.AAC.2